MYHFEKKKRLDGEHKAKIEQENQVKEQKSRTQIVRERIKVYTEKSQRKLFLRGEKPIAKQVLKTSKKAAAKAAQEKAQKSER